jgi:hypothetical protein
MVGIPFSTANAAVLAVGSILQYWHLRFFKILQQVTIIREQFQLHGYWRPKQSGTSYRLHIAVHALTKKWNKMKNTHTRY